MKRDIRDTSLYQEAEAIHCALRRPGAGLISDATEVSTNGDYAAFSGTLVDSLTGAPVTRICLTDLTTGDTRVMTFGPNTDRLPKFSPDGRHIAFLSDRDQAGDFQLYLLDPVSGAAQATLTVEGWVEYFHWSPDGGRILLGVAGHGADLAGAQGAVTSREKSEDFPSWMPSVETGEEAYRWRRTWIYSLASTRVHRVGGADDNVWEAVWCGSSAVAAVLSRGPTEGMWYSASLHIVDTKTSTSREVYRPRDQLGWPTASPSGKQLAIVEALCSDRSIVAGNLRVIDTASGQVKGVETRGVDITYAEWRSERHLLVAGHHGLETVIGLYDAASDVFTETWRSRELTAGGLYAVVAGFGELDDCVLIGEGFLRAPELAVIRQGNYKVVKSFDLGYRTVANVIEAVEGVSWHAPDGLEIQGCLLKPKGTPPYPLVMVVHGGPVWHSHPSWLGRRNVTALMLLKRGYAVFFPNPRGSSGRGQDFVRHVLGEIGGADTYDYLSGLDNLVGRGTADPRRLGVTGGSYGGFMTAWLITQDSRFAAAVVVSPHTNQASAHLISNIPEFFSRFLADKYTNAGGKYFQRSPIMHAHRVRTPTLSIYGALDRCTPPGEAVQFHNALLENGVKSILVTYPQEGHGVRKWPEAIDFAARLVSWFEDHVPAKQPH